MNLLSILLQTMLTKEAVANLSKITGLSSKDIRKILPIAIPLLLRYLTGNASSKKGAASLLEALGQHTDKTSIADQILNADDKDGEKIISHILGLDSDSAINKLSKESGVSSAKVKKLLSLIAPSVLSALSAAVLSGKSSKKEEKEKGADLTQVLSMFMGGSKAEKESKEGGLALLGSLLSQAAEMSGSSKKDESLLSGLLGDDKKKKKNDKSEITALLGSMLGETAGKKDTTEEMIDGSELLTLLSALKK